MKLITKIVSLVGVLLALLVIIAVLGTQSMRKLGEDLTSIANGAVPLSEAVAKITVHQL